MHFQPQGRRYELQPGSLSNLKLVGFDLPDPKAHEVSIAVLAIGLNFADIFSIWGLYKAAPKEAFTPGLEFAGEVIALGESVSDLKVGQEVMGVTRFGAYTSHLNQDARYVAPLPEGWTIEEGASYLVQGLTAYYALFKLGQLQEGDTVLIHSAAGGVGLLANRMAKTKQAYTVGTVGRAEKLDLLKQEGYDQGIVRSSQFKQDLEQALGDRPLQLILDSIGGKVLVDGLDLLAPMGRLITFGSARYASVGNRPNYLKLARTWLTRPKIDPQSLPERNIGILGFNLIWLYEQADLMHEILEEMRQLHLAAPLIGHTFSFDQLPEAILLFQSGKTVGKVVVNF